MFSEGWRLIKTQKINEITSFTKLLKLNKIHKFTRPLSIFYINTDNFWGIVKLPQCQGERSRDIVLMSCHPS